MSEVVKAWTLFLFTKVISKSKQPIFRKLDGLDLMKLDLVKLDLMKLDLLYKNI